MKPGGSLAISASQATALGLGAIGTLLLARVLGPSGRGGLSLLQAISALVATLCLFGTPTLIVRRHLLGPARAIVVPAVAVAAVAGFAVSLAIGGLYLLVSPDTLDESGVTTAALAAAALNAALLIGREAFAARLQSAQRFHRLAVWRVAWAAAPLLAILLYLPWESGASGFFAAIVAANVLMTLMLLPSLKGAWGKLRSFRGLGRASSHREVRAAFGSHVALTLLLFVYRVDVLLLGALSTASAVGIYSIAFVAAELPWLIVNGYAVTLLPRLLKEGPERKQALFRRALLRSAGWALAVVLVIALVGQPAIEIALGSEFADSYVAFLLLAPGVLAFIPFKLLATRLIAAGSPWHLSAICLVLVAFNVVLNLLLAPEYGANGCAAAASATYLLAALFCLPLHRQTQAAERA